MWTMFLQVLALVLLLLEALSPITKLNARINLGWLGLFFWFLAEMPFAAHH